MLKARVQGWKQGEDGQWEAVDLHRSSGSILNRARNGTPPGFLNGGWKGGMAAYSRQQFMYNLQASLRLPGSF